jgi:hypothetical protein
MIGFGTTGPVYCSRVDHYSVESWALDAAGKNGLLADQAGGMITTTTTC